jgi:hypothetical protein
LQKSWNPLANEGRTRSFHWTSVALAIESWICSKSRVPTSKDPDIFVQEKRKDCHVLCVSCSNE